MRPKCVIAVTGRDFSSMRVGDVQAKQANKQVMCPEARVLSGNIYFFPLTQVSDVQEREGKK